MFALIISNKVLRLISLEQFHFEWEMHEGSLFNIAERIKVIAQNIIKFFVRIATNSEGFNFRKITAARSQFNWIGSTNNIM